MTKRRKNSSERTEKVKSEEVITYQVFFQMSLVQQKVKPWQEAEIQAFFKDLGLTDKEPLNTYKDALSKF